MDIDSQPSLRYRLLECTDKLLSVRKRAGHSENIDLRALEEGLRFLRHAIFSSLDIQTPELDQLFLLCLQLCYAISKQSSHDRNATRFQNISVLGYLPCQLLEVLLAAIHALGTYLKVMQNCHLEMRHCNTKYWDGAYISCAIRDLGVHRAHLERVHLEARLAHFQNDRMHPGKIDGHIFVLQQLRITLECLAIFRLRLSVVAPVLEVIEREIVVSELGKMQWRIPLGLMRNH